MKNPTKCKTSFPSTDAPQHVPAGGFATRERCLAVSTEEERQAAVKLVQAYPAQEAIAAKHNIEHMSKELDVIAGWMKSAHGGVPGEMLRRQIREASPEAFDEAQLELTKLRGEALELIKPYLSRLIASLDESLSASALEAEKRHESEGFPICDGQSWALHDDGVCRALWSRRNKAERTLAEVEPSSAIGACQFFLCSEEQEPHTPFSWPS